ncbi:MAG: sulfotransferase domain-containing protein [Marinobacter sp.]
MSTPKVLLHLGLPKTATSSLQHNVLQKLHENKKINFLGKCLDYDYKTAKLEVFNYSGKFIRDAAEEKLPIEEARKQLTTVLDSDVLNVFSDEGLMVAYPGNENLPLKKKFENLNAIFQDYDVQVVVTLRDPVDYLYSLYVQLYPDFCSRVQELNSVQKYVERLLSDPSDVLFESFFYSQWLPELQNRFDVAVFQYQDLAVKAPSAYQGWADVLEVPVDEFSILFDAKRVNEKKKSGKEVQKVRDFKGIEGVFRRSLSRSPIVFWVVKWIYNRTSLKNIFSYRFTSSMKHRFPEGKQYERLNAIFDKGV